MNMTGNGTVTETKCSECMYCKEQMYCIRRKREVKDSDYCLHYVSVNDRHSIVGVADQAMTYLEMFKEVWQE